MCIIIYGKKRIEEEFFRDAYKINKDGIGLMWSQENELKTMVTLDFDLFLEDYNELINMGIYPAIHFRAATIGNVCLENCHPFLVNNDIGLMHNGTMKLGGTTATTSMYYKSQYEYDFDSYWDSTSKPGKTKAKAKTKTDSEEFAELLSELTWEEYDLLDKKIFENMLNGSRVLLMNNFGDVKIINRNSHLAIEEDGIWYSKNNVHKNINVFVYGSLKKGFGNHKHHLEDQRFVKNVTIEGFDMYSIGAFPAIVDGEGTIQGEMYKVSIEAFKSLDRLEGYPNHYDRKLVKCTTGEEAWIYYYKTAPYSRQKVESGIWEQPVYTYKPTISIPKAPKRIRTRKDYEQQVKVVIAYDAEYKNMNKEEKQAHFEMCIELAMMEDDDRFGKASREFEAYFGHSYYGKYEGDKRTSTTWIPTPKKQRLEWLTQQYTKVEVPKLTELVKKQREETQEESIEIWAEAEERCKHLTGNTYTRALFQAYDDIWAERLKKEEEGKIEVNSIVKPDSQEDIWENAEKAVLNRWIKNGKARNEKDVLNNNEYWDDVSKFVIEVESAEYIDAVAKIDEVPDLDDPFYYSE